ncbi:hypothetical protein HPB51_011731 [Rhipicephalus microplus]|uniref:CCHC-type domain-containing protein n=1 Tax=Rhipicephalus microplus TaxID=6941 RepID=A0A9J6DN04_RHIMP|nr:hypothetical protein HPB51_011731 [Rhipicephalus microplus]
MSSSAPINAAAIPEDQSSLRDLIREIVREELQKFRNPVAQTPVASVAELVRHEIRHAFSTAGPGDEHRPMSYADAVRRSPSGTSPPYHPVPTAPWSPRQEQTLSRPPSQPTYHQASTAAPWTSSQEGRLRRPPLRRTDAWRTIDRRPLCFNCGGAGHIARHCWHRNDSFRQLRTWSDDRRANEEYIPRREDASFHGARSHFYEYRTSDEEAIPTRQPGTNQCFLTRHFIVLELGYAGKPLSRITLRSAVQGRSVVLQASCCMAVAERALGFRHLSANPDKLLVTATDAASLEYHLPDRSPLTIDSAGPQGARRRLLVLRARTSRSSEALRFKGNVTWLGAVVGSVMRKLRSELPESRARAERGLVEELSMLQRRLQQCDSVGEFFDTLSI